MDNEIKRIVDAVIHNDADPESAEYNTYDYGVRVASSLTSEQAAVLITECLKSLSSSLAATFLEGVLDGTQVPQLEKVLLTSLSQSKEVSSAGPIVDWLIARCGLNPRSIAIQILDAIRGIADAKSQNTHAYALWVLPSMTDEHTASALEIKNMIDHLLQEANLTTYARDILSASKAKWIG